MRAEVASDTLVALSRNHFSLVVYELQHCLRPLNLTEEFVIVTLAKLANGNGRARGASAPVSDPFKTIPCSCQASALVSAPTPLHFLLPFSGIPPFHLCVSLCPSQPPRFSLCFRLSFLCLYSCHPFSSKSLSPLSLSGPVLSLSAFSLTLTFSHFLLPSLPFHCMNMC